MSSGEEFKLQILDGEHEGIALMTMDRPKANALGKNMMDEFREAIDRVRFDQNLRVVVLQSALPKIFCAGADLKERVQMEQEEVARFVHGLRNTFIAMEQLPMPTIAAIEGAALGGGLELVSQRELTSVNLYPVLFEPFVRFVWAFFL